MRVMPSWACPLMLVTGAVTVLFFAGCDDDSSKPAPDPLGCSISADPAAGTAPVDIAFTAEVTSGQTPYSFEWGFGDGASSTQQGPVHRYEAAGIYTVALTVSDAGGATAEDELELVIEPAVFSCTAIADPSSGPAPLQVRFTGEVTGGTAPLSFTWDFGDGSATSQQQNPVHDYGWAGVFEAKLTVTGAADQCECWVTVEVQ